MQVTFDNVQIQGVLSVLPENRQSVKETTTTSDLLIYGMDYLLEKCYIKKEEIGAIIAVSSSPDYYVPFLSYMVHGAFHLDEDILCLDIMESGIKIVKGLFEACMLAEHMKDKKIILVTGDVWSRQRKNDQFHMLDEAEIMIVSYAKGAESINLEIGTDSHYLEWGKESQGAFADLFHKAKPSPELDANLQSDIENKVRENKQCFEEEHGGHDRTILSEHGPGMQWANATLSRKDLTFHEVIQSDL